MTSARYQRGRRKLKSIHGAHGVETIDKVGQIAPDIARLVYEFAYGDIVARPGLDVKSRQLATLAALVAMGNARPQLKAHLHGSMNVGWTKAQVIETIMQLIVYCGFPVALNALSAADEVFPGAGGAPLNATRDHGFEVYSIATPDGQTRASFVPELGAIGSSIVLSGREVLFHHDFFWATDTQRTRGGWPFLFPICGRLERDGKPEEYVHGGQTYRMPIHGFSSRMPWKVVSVTDQELTVSLSDTEATRVMFPFAFAVLLRYRVENSSLVCEQTYSNRGDQPMPYYAGFHPYFLTPAPGPGKEATMARFQPIRRLTYNENLSSVVGEGPAPTVPVSVTAPHINEMLVELGKEKECRLAMPDGFTIHIEADAAFPYLQLYTMPDKPFFCLEPWMGFPNAMNSGHVRTLAPGASEKASVRIWCSHASARRED